MGIIAFMKIKNAKYLTIDKNEENCSSTILELFYDLRMKYH